MLRTVIYTGPNTLSGALRTGMIGKVMGGSFNTLDVAFPEMLVAGYVGDFNSVSRGRRVIKERRKIAQQPFNGAAADRACAIDALNEMAEARYRLQRSGASQRDDLRDLFAYHRANNLAYRNAVTLP